MLLSRFKKIAMWGLVILILISIVSALAASNVIVDVPALEDYSQGVTANDLKPPECAGLDLSTIIVSGNGTSGNDLMLGTAGRDSFNGKGGNDCLVGGGGNDNLRGGKGDDILIGGDGVDQCKDKWGSNTFIDCE